MLISLEAAKLKLSAYYRDVDKIEGHICVIGTIILRKINSSSSRLQTGIQT